ncbi:DUF4892 domain-containing protein [Pseudomaricurvus sp. HS19]|uniref:DUF4892 domain-containing protein n=1 Tax=Pseudomaricurvus sp. HS19 TaxID=2692626 RepID=UPI0013710EBE|nr:DUF4892 domain-containing protein [Pseudomaricurvus sp. HS19]MYM62740.1 DUF4892 domain-containing protein [Pseudomaricurvus sp. HS19]
MVKQAFRRICQRLLWGGAMLVVAAPLQALPVAPFPHLQSLVEEQRAVDDYPFTLGGLKKINGQWVADKEYRLTGELERHSYQVEGHYGYQEVFEYYRKQLLQQGAQELYRCDAFRCGSSNAWANSRFMVKQLYGLDQYQSYAAFTLQDEQGEMQNYVALYAVQRGNRRNYVHLDVIRSPERLGLISSAEVVEAQLQQGHSFLLPEGEQLAEQLKIVATLMSRKPGWHLAVVGVDSEEAPLSQQLERSRARAEEVSAQLVSQGVAADRLQLFGLGGVLPDLLRGKQKQAVYLTRIRP